MKNNKPLFVTIILLVLFLMIGLSYAYFTAIIIGQEESTTITTTTGILKIVYDGGKDINITDIIPSNKPFTIKTFTVTGNNTTPLTIFYNLYIVTEQNTFSNNSIKYKLLSFNTDANGTTIDSMTEHEPIQTGESTIHLGKGNFVGPTDGNKMHTYYLELYFSSTSINQNENQGKTFKAFIDIKE